MPLKAPSKSGNGSGKMAMPMVDDEFGDISSDFKGDDFDDFDDDEGRRRRRIWRRSLR